MYRSTHIVENLSVIYHKSTKEKHQGTVEGVDHYSSMIKTMFLNLTILGSVCLTIPVGTASVEHFFTHIKMIKPCLGNRLGEHNLSYLMKIALKSPEA